MTMNVDTYAPDLAVKIMGKLLGADRKRIGTDATFDVILAGMNDGGFLQNAETDRL